MTDPIPSDGYFVITINGDIGLTTGEDVTIDDDGGADRIITVQFGPSGPFEQYSETELEPATEDDVARAGLSGVGGKFIEIINTEGKF